MESSPAEEVGSSCPNSQIIGYLTRASWRWVFAINLPIGVLAVLVVILFLRKSLFGPQAVGGGEMQQSVSFTAQLKTIDVVGQTLFVLGFGLIVLGLTWGGVQYPWTSPAVLVPLIAGILLICAFACWEREMEPGRRLAAVLSQKPMIPWCVISKRDIGILFYTECATGMTMFSVSTPRYFGIVIGHFVLAC